MSSGATTLSEIKINGAPAGPTRARKSFVSAMASGASGPDPTAWGFGAQQHTQPMAATPQNRRARPQREEGVGIRETPNAKRSVKATDPVQAPGPQANMDQVQLTAGYHLVHAQAFDNLAHIAEIKEVLDDHAARLDRYKPLWSALTRIEDTLRQTNTDLAETARQVANNDTQLKGNLKELEVIVTEHGVAIPQLRADVQGAVTEIALQASSRAAQPAASGLGVGPPHRMQ